ncbi:MAG: DUF4328 domain-containing protein [Kouleothrix sp.]|jgi:hypothetical protein|nr:DUF4328 domain-containing protein [Kouleothrix sp.]
MDLKPHATLTKTLCALLKITIGVLAIAVLTDFYNLYSYSTLSSDVDVNEVILPSDVVVIVVGLIQLILTVITGITFLRWIYRSNKNLRMLSGESMVFTPGWSVGWYFIPIANFYKPYQAMKEIWDISHRNAATDHALVGWWWALWLISNFLGRLAFRLVLRADNVSSYAASAIVYIISDGLDIILTIVALAMVTRIGNAYAQNIVEPSEPGIGLRRA